MQASCLGRRIGALHRPLVVVPKLGDAVDVDIGRLDVDPRPLAEDVRLHVAAHTWNGMGQGRVNLVPVLDEVFMAEPVLAGQ